jgi:urease accessory protein
LGPGDAPNADFVISEAVAYVAAPNVLRDVRSAPPVTLRQVISDGDATCCLCLVGSAAGPLPGDELVLRLVVAAGARASLTSSGAMIAQGQGGPVGRLTIDVEVGAGASLDADPGALIVCAKARVDVRVSIRLADDARLRWRELVVLGRSGEPPGAISVDWDVSRGTRPLLRQRIDLIDPAATRWDGQLGPYRRLDSELRVGPDFEARSVVHGPNHVTQKLAEGATLSTELSNPSADAAIR